jgi:hypothetical protein
MKELLARKVSGPNSGRMAGLDSAMGINDLLQRLDLMEKKDKKVGIAATIGFASLLFLALLFWIAKAGYAMGIQDPEWKTVGLLTAGANFGTSDAGNGQVETMQSAGPERKITQTSPSQDTKTTTSGAVTQQEKSPISHADGNDGSKTAQKAIVDSQAVVGGTNQGGGDRVGNEGNPGGGVKFLWGPELGSGGRMAVNTELAGYDVQLEEKITFQITIDPAGDVVFVKPLFAIHQELVEIGKRNILKWKFSEGDPALGNLKTSVSIYFRLK